MSKPSIRLCHDVTDIWLQPDHTQHNKAYWFIHGFLRSFRRKPQP